MESACDLDKQSREAHLGPVFQTDLEDFTIIDCRDLDKVEMGIDEQILVFRVLDQAQVVLKVVSEKECEVADELLVIVVRSSVCRGHICVVSYMTTHQSTGAYLYLEGPFG